jgi:L-asparaginase/Glu-tRNA(Gln) amidotransferase subunit D
MTGFMLYEIIRRQGRNREEERMTIYLITTGGTIRGYRRTDRNATSGLFR